MRGELEADGSRRWDDRTVNRIIAHLKTFVSWVHKHGPFPLGQPTQKIKTLSEASLLAVERALSPTERRRVLDAADLLLEVGGRSRDVKDRPRRKDYRAYQNRAVSTRSSKRGIETGMRRAAVAAVNLADVGARQQVIHVEEKGGVMHGYHISRQGMQAILDYVETERPRDAEYFDSPVLFLPAHMSRNETGRLSANAIG